MKKKFLSFIKGKKITLMGLGLLGRGIGVAKYIAQQPGVQLLITDLKTEDQLKPSLDQLKKNKNITYRLGEHYLEDFETCDLVIHGPNIPDDNIYLQHAWNNNIPTYTDETLFLRFLNKIAILGITGTRGKSTTTMMIYHVLQNLGTSVYLGGNMRGIANLPLLDSLESGDIIVMELSSWQLSDWRRKKTSPHIGIFTNFLDDHLNYYHNDRSLYWQDKAAIFNFQNEDDVCIFGPQFQTLRDFPIEGDGQKIFTNLPSKPLPLLLPGEHNQANAICALTACETLGLSRDDIVLALATFAGVEGRQQNLGEYSRRTIINDNNATTPDATIAALKAYGDVSKSFLLCGGATKNLDIEVLVKIIAKTCKGLILLDNTGTQELLLRVQNNFHGEIHIFSTLKECVDCFFNISSEWDILIFSPAFASFGSEFQNEYERNDFFIEYLQKYATKSSGKI